MEGDACSLPEKFPDPFPWSFSHVLHSIATCLPAVRFSPSAAWALPLLASLQVHICSHQFLRDLEQILHLIFPKGACRKLVPPPPFLFISLHFSIFPFTFGQDTSRGLAFFFLQTSQETPRPRQDLPAMAGDQGSLLNTVAPCVGLWGSCGAQGGGGGPSAVRVLPGGLGVPCCSPITSSPALLWDVLEIFKDI